MDTAATDCSTHWRSQWHANEYRRRRARLGGTRCDILDLSGPQGFV
jgi:hypothetical protein